MWPDNETEVDLIGFRVHADLIREVVTDPKLLPVTLGIFGDWGNGKTSIMQMLRKDLDPEKTSDVAQKEKLEKVAVLYFNGWLFEGFDDAKAALLTSILAQLAEHKRFGPKIRDKAAALIKRVNWMRVVKFGLKDVAAPAIAAYVSGGITAVPSLMNTVKKLLPGGKKDEDDDDDDEKDEDGKGKEGKEKSLEKLVKEAPEADGAMDVRTFRKQFEKMLKASDITSLIVLIDDLDRCSPETIIENLEAIKLFLNVENTAFVIGADPRIVRHAIAVRYKEAVKAAEGSVDDQREGARLIEDYLEKLVQVPYHLPRLSPTEIETYVTLLFCKRDLDDATFQSCVTACEEQRRQNRFQAFGFQNVRAVLQGKTIPASLSEALSISSAAAGLITECLKGNPRQVKRFLNAYTLRRKLAKVAGMESLKDEVLIKLMLLEYAEEKRFREIASLQEIEQGYPEKLRNLEAAALGEEIESKGMVQDDNWKSERLQRWLKMEPRLKDVDLRDYFWLARDRLASTLTAVKMVSPLVRRIFEGLTSKATRGAAAVSLAELDAEGIDALHDLLNRNFIRQPTGDAFDALKRLVEVRPESAAFFADVLLAIPVGRLEASLPGQLEIMAHNKPELQKLLKPVLAQIAKHPDTKAGKALAREPTRKAK